MSARDSGSTDPAPTDARRRVHSRVALTLLQTLKNQDLPAEILDDENVSLTLPRRLGLSEAVEAQIRRYRDDVRRRRRITDQEVVDLIRLVTRRPDSHEVFLTVGDELHGGSTRPGWRRILPRRLAHALARRRIDQRLRYLTGRKLVDPSGSPLVLEGVDDLLIRGDPGGDACGIVTGLARAEMARVGEEPGRLHHTHCLSGGDDICRWMLDA